MDRYYKGEVIHFDEDTEEGIISENFSKFDPIDFSQQNKFPYCFVGKLTSEFKAKRIAKSGVGILIGPGIVLTAGHNLTHIDPKTQEIEVADRVGFTVGSNGEFEPFPTIYTDNFYLPSDFIKGVKEKLSKTQLLNDWAVLYLGVQIGKAVKKLYNLETLSYVREDENGLFSYFNEGLKQTGDLTNAEISIIGYSDFQFEIEMGNGNLTDNKKNDIDINIQISTKEEGLVIGKFTNLNIKNNKLESQMPLDFIILNSSISAKNKVINTNKSVISESKGQLCDVSDNLKYKISTYKGQSGSPIFLRQKKYKNFIIDSENFFSNNVDFTRDEDNFIYKFIGIHSRRGPLVYDNIVFTENDNENDKVETQIKPLEKKSTKDITNEMVKKEALKFISSNGICEFNEGLMITGDKGIPISVAVQSKLNMKTVQNDPEENINDILTKNSSSDYKIIHQYKPEEAPNSQFVNITLVMNDKEKLVGLFKRNVKLDVLFNFGSEILNIDIKYIILNQLTGKKKKMLWKYDYDKTLNICLNNDETSSTLELEVNMLYGEELGQKVLNKYFETQEGKLDYNELKQNFRKVHMKPLFDSIFDEISQFLDIHPIFGKLFTKIRGYILNKIGLSD